MTCSHTPEDLDPLDELRACRGRETEQERQQAAEAEREALRRQRLRQQIYRVATFSLERVIVRPGSDPEPHLYDQWAWAWHDFRRWLSTAGLEERLSELVAGDDLQLAVVLRWLQIAGDPDGRRHLQVSLRDAASTPKLLRSILEALWGLPDMLLPQAPAPIHGNAPPAFAEARPAEAARLPDARGQRLRSCALGLRDSKTWVKFRKLHGRWQEHGVVRVPRGLQTDLLRGFVQGGGLLERRRAIRDILKTPSGQDEKAIMDILKPPLSRLRKIIRKAFSLPDVNPLPWQGDVRGWRAAIEIGYAVSEDRPYSGSKSGLTFKTASELAGRE